MDRIKKNNLLQDLDPNIVGSSSSLLEESSSSTSFRGNFDYSLDEKGRVSVPSQFRSVLSKRNTKLLVITNFICDGARCLEAFTEEDWRKFEQNLSKKSRFDPQLKKLENFYLSRAAECSLDSSGRINIPQNLRTYAGLEKDIVFTASLHGFRIWDQRVWNLIFQEAEAALLENPALFIDVDRQ